MATGLPCVVAELPGITDYIFEHPTDSPVSVDTDADGIIVAQEDASALAAALDAILENPALRATLGANARARAVAGFELGTIADQYVDLYGELRESRA